MNGGEGDDRGDVSPIVRWQKEGRNTNTEEKKRPEYQDQGTKRSLGCARRVR